MGLPVDVVGAVGLSLVDIDYLAIGNPTVDQLPDGSGVVGGTVVYASVQAAQLGWSARVIGRGNDDELAPLLPQDDRIAWDIESAPVSTKFTNDSQDGERVQLLHASAGPIDFGADVLAARVVHLGPVDAEVDLDMACANVAADAFVGATPQGAFRVWGADQVVHLRPVTFAVPTMRRLNAVVVGGPEAEVAAQLLQGVAAAGGLVVVTRGSKGCELWSGDVREVIPPAVHVDEVDDTGAGDVFATGLFIKLAEGAPVTEAIRFGQAAAAASVRGLSVSAIADEIEITALLASSDASAR